MKPAPSPSTTITTADENEILAVLRERGPMWLGALAEAWRNKARVAWKTYRPEHVTRTVETLRARGAIESFRGERAFLILPEHVCATCDGTGHTFKRVAPVKSSSKKRR